MRIIQLAILALTRLALCAEEKVDLNMIHQIKAEAFQNSRVMEHLFYFTDVHGPRLTGSPAYRRASEWAMGRFRDYGFVNTHLEPWGPFGRGWECANFVAQLEKPRPAPLIGFALPWSPGTEGPVTREPVFAPIATEADFGKYQGKIRDAIVLIDAPRSPGLMTSLPPQRFTGEALAAEAVYPDPLTPGPFQPLPADRVKGREQLLAYRDKLSRFLSSEGARVVVTVARGGAYGNTYGTSFGSRDPKGPVPPPAIVLTAEHYNRIVRLIEHKIPVRLTVDVTARFLDDTQESFNVIAELPGGAKRDEVVMLGAHLDSWAGGTGATDNATGAAVVLEAARILKSVGAQMDRTVRVALWGGEEQGILGSQAYVKQHFGPEHALLSAYFNLDYGAGKIRGIYLQNNDAARPIFEHWMAPFEDLGVTTVSIRNGGGTDHLSFDAAGLPGFQFIQDPLEYGSRTHHQSMDVYERAVAADLMQSAAVMASVVYHAANRPELLPRKSQ